jgi:hypothetical protein
MSGVDAGGMIASRRGGVNLQSERHEQARGEIGQVRFSIARASLLCGAEGIFHGRDAHDIFLGFGSLEKFTDFEKRLPG